MNRTLKDKVAIVVGAGPGVGRATARALARDGAAVVVAARRREPLEALAKEVAHETGRRCLALPTDMGDAQECERLVATSVETFGRLDVLVNVATFASARTQVEDMDWGRDYQAALDINVVATMRLCGLAAKQMVQTGGGAIVNIGTLNTTTKLPKMAAYTSTKAAMEVASKTMAREVGGRGVRVNIVTPGFVTGADLDQVFEEMAQRMGGDGEELKNRAAQQAVLQRHTDPEDIAEAVLFLASDRSRNITGVALHVNAGQWID